jgi:hypothetical protein
MSKTIRNFLLVAAVLIILGGVISGIGFALGGLAPVSITPEGVKLLNGGGRQTDIKENYENLTSIDIDTDVMELRLEEGDSFKLTGSYNSDLIKVEIEESGGELRVRTHSANNGLFGWNWLNFGFGVYNQNYNELTLVYPKDTQFDAVALKSNLGSLRVGNLSAGALAVTLDAGSFNGTNIATDTLDVNMNLGACTIDRLVAKEYAGFKLDAGGLILEESKLNNATIKQNLGGCDFSGLLTGEADISLDLGSLNLNLENKEESLSYSIKTDLGSITVNGRGVGSPANQSAKSPECSMNLQSNLGSIHVSTR